MQFTLIHYIGVWTYDKDSLISRTDLDLQKTAGQLNKAKRLAHRKSNGIRISLWVDNKTTKNYSSASSHFWLWSGRPNMRPHQSFPIFPKDINDPTSD